MTDTLTTPEATQVVYLDPRPLIENPHNPRADLGDLTEMVQSIRESGVLEPLIVVPTDEGGHMVMFGHRRRAAAIDAEQATVPCIVRPEYVGKTPEQIADMLAENLHRQDLTAVEEAEGYAQLAAFDWTPEQIASRTGRKVDRVRHGIAAAALPEDVRPHVATGSLTLEQAAALDEFADDSKAMTRLLKASESGYGIHYALADEQAKKAKRQRKAETKAALLAEGVRIVPKPKGFPWGTVELAVERLTDSKDRKITVKEHGTCPGNAAFMGDDGGAVYICQHPKEWGHNTPSDYRHMSNEEAAEAEAEAEARRAFEEARAVATEARRSFLREHLTRRGKVPAGTLRRATEIIFGFHTSRDVDPRMVADLLGVDGDVMVTLPEAAAKVTEARLPLLMLAYAAAKAEDNLGHIDQYWRSSSELGERWLTVVAELGYPLTDAEQQVKELCRYRIEEKAAAGDEDDEYGDDWYDESVEDVESSGGEASDEQSGDVTDAAEVAATD
jgi:ParB family transcriptional regulator, chromosome partitioning protein